MLGRRTFMARNSHLELSVIHTHTFHCLVPSLFSISLPLLAPSLVWTTLFMLTLLFLPDLYLQPLSSPHNGLRPSKVKKSGQPLYLSVFQKF